LFDLIVYKNNRDCWQKIAFKNLQAVKNTACSVSFLFSFAERMADRFVARLFVGMSIHF
jgi:hypothetical protein